MYLSRPDSYRNIQKYAKEYVAKVRSISGGQGLTGPSADAEIFAVVMEKEDVARLLLHPHCYKLAAIIGIADDGDGEKITVSLLAVGEDGKVLEEHRKSVPDEEQASQSTLFDLPLAGEEVWPRKISFAQLDDFLP